MPSNNSKYVMLRGCHVYFELKLWRLYFHELLLVIFQLKISEIAFYNLRYTYV